jgi:VanZ family protein
VSLLQRYILNLPKLLFARPAGRFLDREVAVFEECHQAVMGEVAHIDVAHGEFHPGRPPAFADGAMILDCWAGGGRASLTGSQCGLPTWKSADFDGSFIVGWHEWGMTPTDCSVLRLPKTHLIRVAAGSAAIVIAAASLSPQSPAIQTGFGDKLDHLAAYSVLSLLVALGWSGRFAPGVIVGAAVGFGGLLELLQHFSPGRQADWADFAVNSVGAVTGLALAMLVRRTLAAFARTPTSSSP